MDKLRQDSIYLLQGMTLTLAITGAIATGGGVLLFFTTIFAPTAIKENVQQLTGDTFAGEIMLVAMIQTIGWGVLAHIRFISPQVGWKMMKVMGTITLFMFGVVLFSIL